MSNTTNFFMKNMIGFLLLLLLATQTSFAQNFAAHKNVLVNHAASAAWDQDEAETYFSIKVLRKGFTQGCFQESKNDNGILYVSLDLIYPNLLQSSDKNTSLSIPLFYINTENNGQYTVFEYPYALALLNQIKIKLEAKSASSLMIKFRFIRKNDIESFIKLSDQISFQYQNNLNDLSKIVRTINVIDSKIDNFAYTFGNVENLLSIIGGSSTHSAVVYGIESKRMDCDLSDFSKRALIVDEQNGMLRVRAGKESEELDGAFVTVSFELSSYLKADTLPSSYQTDYRCESLESQFNLFNQRINNIQNLMTKKQETLERELLSVYGDYLNVTNFLGIGVPDFDDSNSNFPDDGWEENKEDNDESPDGIDPNLRKLYIRYYSHYQKFQSNLNDINNPSLTNYFLKVLDGLSNCIKVNINESSEDNELYQKLVKSCH